VNIIPHPKAIVPDSDLTMTWWIRFNYNFIEKGGKEAVGCKRTLWCWLQK